jgi:uncharacterized protein YlxP (DUF503 family)
VEWGTGLVRLVGVTKSLTGRIVLQPVGPLTWPEVPREPGRPTGYRTPVHVVAFEVEIRIPDSQSLKDRRQVVRSLLDGARRRFAVSAAEVGGQNTWQRATLGFAVVASEARLAEGVVDQLDRFIWSHPDIEIVHSETHWLE